MGFFWLKLRISWCNLALILWCRATYGKTTYCLQRSLEGTLLIHILDPKWEFQFLLISNSQECAYMCTHLQLNINIFWCGWYRCVVRWRNSTGCFTTRTKYRIWSSRLAFKSARPRPCYGIYLTLRNSPLGYLGTPINISRAKNIINIGI